jgi:hypothetical protein
MYITRLRRLRRHEWFEVQVECPARSRVNLKRYGVIVLVVLAAGAWLLLRSAPPEPEGFTERAAKIAKPYYETVPQIPVPTSVDEALSVLELGTIRVADLLGRERSYAALGAAAEFLVKRFGRSDQVAYRKWRESLGFRWHGREFLEKWWDISKQYAKYSPSSPVAPSEVFDLLYREKTNANAGFNRVVGMAGDASGISVVFGTMTPGNPGREYLGGRLPSEMWHGGISSTHCSWFAPPRPYKERLALGEHVQYAEIGVILSHADGSRRPLVMTFVWDNTASRWDLQVLNTSNEPSRKLVSIDY